MTGRSMRADLRDPDPVGRDLALYRTRVYRFSDDRRHYVLAERLEERYIAGRPPSPATLAYISQSLAAIRACGDPPAFEPDIARQEGIDFEIELHARRPYDYRAIPQAVPERVVAIVGAPRSGTSHLYNLLAFRGRFAYFTTASCWA